MSVDVCLAEVVGLSQDVFQIKTLTGDHGENFHRIVTEVELLGQGCDLCARVEAELRALRNQSQSGKAGCPQTCSHLEDEVRLLREGVQDCVGQCRGGSGEHKRPVRPPGECERSAAALRWRPSRQMPPFFPVR